MNNEELKSNLLSATHWIRLVYMILFALILQVAGTVMYLVVTVQFVYSLVTGKNHEVLRKFGGNLSAFIYQTLRFLSYNSEEKPFPFADWPETSGDKNSVSPATSVVANTVVEVEVAEVKVKESKRSTKSSPKTKSKAKPKSSVADKVKPKASAKAKTAKDSKVETAVKTKSKATTTTKTTANADEVAEAKDFIQQEDA